MGVAVMNLEGFVVDLVRKCQEQWWGDLDGCDLQDLMMKHGLCVERPATEKDCEEDWAQEYGYEPGDKMIAHSDELQALLDKS